MDNLVANLCLCCSLNLYTGMIDKSGANLLLNASVVSVSRKQNGQFHVRHHSGGESEPLADAGFDNVVVAAPVQFSNITFEPGWFPKSSKIEYVRLHVTLLSTPHKLDPIFFGIELGDSVPEVILTTLPTTQARLLPFFSISTLRKLNNPRRNPPRREYAYKIFSKEAPSIEFLAHLFGFEVLGNGTEIDGENVSWMYRKLWHSYPRLRPRADFLGPSIDSGLYYTAGIEPFISTMETSSLMGMNVAKLISQSWESDTTMQEHRMEL